MEEIAALHSITKSRRAVGINAEQGESPWKTVVYLRSWGKVSQGSTDFIISSPAPKPYQNLMTRSSILLRVVRWEGWKPRHQSRLDPFRSMDKSDPKAFYTQRREELYQGEEILKAWEGRLGLARFFVFCAGCFFAWSTFASHSLSGWWLAGAIGLFLCLLLFHERINRRWFRQRMARHSIEMGIERLADRWMGRGNAGLRFQREDHPYAADLDIFGSHSLFERVCLCQTRVGEDKLAGWLLQAGSPESIKQRQQALIELAPMGDLRERMYAYSKDAAPVDLEPLEKWGQMPISRVPLGIRILAVILTVVTFYGFFEWISGRWDLWVWASSLLATLVLNLVFRGVTRPVLEIVEKQAADLSRLGGMLRLIEKKDFQSQVLRDARERLHARKEPPSRAIGRLWVYADLLSSRKNALFAPLAIAMSWELHITHLVESWRTKHGQYLGEWFATLGEFDALISLAAYAFENPDHTFAEVVEKDIPFIRADAAGHPLISSNRCVRNDIRLGGQDPRLLVISGSNMSGKSTYLRTVGMTAVMALAGLPVRARQVSLSPLQVGASMRITDSLSAGRSRFQAEIERVRLLVCLCDKKPPLLFLLDEIFSGTNSHDRLEGARGVVGGLMRQEAIGMVTTHDLALTRIAEEIGVPSDNVHFSDRWEEQELHFDYKMRPGVTRHSNALALMRAVGLEV